MNDENYEQLCLSVACMLDRHCHYYCVLRPTDEGNGATVFESEFTKFMR